MLAICLSAPTVLENGSQDEIFRLSQNLKWLHSTIYKIVFIIECNVLIYFIAQVRLP